MQECFQPKIGRKIRILSLGRKNNIFNNNKKECFTNWFICIPFCPNFLPKSTRFLPKQPSCPLNTVFYLMFKRLRSCFTQFGGSSNCYNFDGIRTTAPLIATMNVQSERFWQLSIYSKVIRRVPSHVVEVPDHVLLSWQTRTSEPFCRYPSLHLKEQ